MSKLAANLYWISGDVKERNWFVLAESLKAAIGFHAKETGSRALSKDSYFVLGYPAFTILPATPPRYASLTQLKALGFQIVQEGPRAVRLGSAWFIEGDAHNKVPEWNTYMDQIAERSSLNKLTS